MVNRDRQCFVKPNGCRPWIPPLLPGGLGDSPHLLLSHLPPGCLDLLTPSNFKGALGTLLQLSQCCSDWLASVQCWLSTLRLIAQTNGEPVWDAESSKSFSSGLRGKHQPCSGSRSHPGQTWSQGHGLAGLGFPRPGFTPAPGTDPPFFLARPVIPAKSK